jgi:hypothetical protein
MVIGVNREKVLNNKELMQQIEAYNNTICRLIDDQIYIDSMKYPRVFKELGQELGFEVKILNEPTDKMVLYGEESSGFKVKGVEFLCFAMKVVR